MSWPGTGLLVSGPAEMKLKELTSPAGSVKYCRQPGGGLEMVLGLNRGITVFKLRLGASGGYPVGLLVCLRHELLDKVASIGLEVMVLGVVGGCISKKVMLVCKVRI